HLAPGLEPGEQEVEPEATQETEVGQRVVGAAQARGREIADAVAARDLPRDDARPDRRGQRRLQRLQIAPRAPIPQRLEVRQVAPGDERVQEIPVRAVHADEREAVALASWARRAGVAAA